MGKTYRALDYVGSIRHLRTLSEQRGSLRLLDELSEVGIKGNFSRLRQQAHRHTYKFPNSWDDLPVSAYSECDGRQPHRVQVWYVGGDTVSVHVDELYEHLEQLRANGIHTVEVQYDGKWHVVTFRSGYSGSREWCVEYNGAYRGYMARQLGLRPRTRYRARQFPTQKFLDELRAKPSNVTVHGVLTKRGLVSIQKAASLPARAITGVLVSVPRGSHSRSSGTSLIDGVRANVSFQGYSNCTLDLQATRYVFGRKTRSGYQFNFWWNDPISGVKRITLS
jgi:hypothetical protein